MKTVAGMLVVLGMMLTACDPTSNMDPAPQEAATLPEAHERTQEAAAVRGDCTASIYCGNWASCSGTLGRCQAIPASETGYYWGAVSCTTGTSTVNVVGCNPIQIPTCGCGQDGCCSEVCYRDPDCGLSACVNGRSCTSASQCGGVLNGSCNAQNKCVCAN